MLNSTKSSLAMRRMFKKMTDNIKWNGNINLVEDWSIVPYDDEAFRKYFKGLSGFPMIIIYIIKQVLLISKQ